MTTTYEVWMADEFVDVIRKRDEEKKADMKELRRLLNSHLISDEGKAVELVYKYLKRYGKIYKKTILLMKSDISKIEFAINDISDIHFNGREFYFVQNAQHCEEIKRYLMSQLLEDGIICDHSKKASGVIDIWHF